jgi:catechol 2,3-dioxygenase
MTALEVSPLWPADLDHLRLDSPQPETLAAFYACTLGMAVSPLSDGTWLAAGSQRRLVIGRGAARGQPYSAYSLADDAQLERYRRYIGERGAEPIESPTPLFAQGAFAVRDPDGRLAVFGVARDAPPSQSGPSLPGRLQHVVVASERFPAMMAFYRDVLGFLVSDTVHVDDGTGGLGEVNVCFLRGNLEHHSLDRKSVV